MADSADSESDSILDPDARLVLVVLLVSVAFCSMLVLLLLVIDVVACY